MDKNMKTCFLIATSIFAVFLAVYFLILERDYGAASIFVKEP